MMYDFGPQTRRVYAAMRDRIVGGELAPGTKLPSHTDLASAFGVAPQTMRHVLAILEQEGLVLRQHGRGTFVREPAIPAVLIVDDDPSMRDLLRTFVTNAGYRAIVAANPTEGLTAIERDPAIGLVLSDVRMPTAIAGIEFIRAVRRRWPALPLAAVTGYPGDLVGLHGTPDCPVLILPKPVRSGQINEILRLALRPPSPNALVHGLPHGVLSEAPR